MDKISGKLLKIYKSFSESISKFMPSFLNSIKLNAVALISLVIAIIALTYNTWRDEETEKNRTVRLAAFEVLKHLGELQIVINSSHYQGKDPQEQIFLGWGHVSLISDLSNLLPDPVPEKIKQLVNEWKSNWKAIPTDEAVADQVTNQVDISRQATLDAIRHLR